MLIVEVEGIRSARQPAAATRIYHSESAIGLGMATVATVCCPLAAATLALGLKAMREAVPKDAN